MRASPACQVSLQRFGVWRTAVAGLCLAGLATLATWFATRNSPPSLLLIVAVVAVCVLTAWIGMTLWRIPAVSLRWDGQAWQLDAMPGDLQVAIDLGPWMLLRFRSHDSAGTRWLPLQRRGLEPQWHALRCAVYSPRAAAADR